MKTIKHVLIDRLDKCKIGITVKAEGLTIPNEILVFENFKFNFIIGKCNPYIESGELFGDLYLNNEIKGEFHVSIGIQSIKIEHRDGQSNIIETSKLLHVSLCTNPNVDTEMQPIIIN